MSAALVVALALGALAASTAAASETLSFIPHSGKFPVKKVSVKASEISFNEEGTTYGCGATTGEGEITSAKAGWLKLRLTECKVEVGEPFNSPGAKSGEIIAEKVPVELVYASKEKHEAALDLNYQASSEEKAKTFMTWEILPFGYKGCGVRGPVLSAVTPVNSASLTHTAKLKVAATGDNLQIPSKYETEAGSKYTALPETNMFCDFWAQGGVGSSGSGQTLEITTNATEGALEIKA